MQTWLEFVKGICIYIYLGKKNKTSEGFFLGTSLKSSENYVTQACEPYPDQYSYGIGQ